MQRIPEPSPEIRNFAKTILAVKDSPMCDLTMASFRAGAWYMDAISILVLTLPDDDPTLAQILASMRSTTLFENDVIAKNVLRYDIAREETLAFVVANVNAESVLLHARALIQSAARPPANTAISKSKAGLSLIALLADRLLAAHGDPLWWLAVGTIGTLIFL